MITDEDLDLIAEYRKLKKKVGKRFITEMAKARIKYRDLWKKKYPLRICRRLWTQTRN